MVGRNERSAVTAPKSECLEDELPQQRCARYGLRVRMPADVGPKISDASNRNCRAVSQRVRGKVNGVEREPAGYHSLTYCHFERAD
jgi:hypothetical protein